MCNLYDVGPAPNRQVSRWASLVRAGLAGLPKIFHIRKTDAGLVLRDGEDEVRAEIPVSREERRGEEGRGEEEEEERRRRISLIIHIIS